MCVEKNGDVIPGSMSMLVNGESWMQACKRMQCKGSKWNNANLNQNGAPGVASAAAAQDMAAKLINWKSVAVAVLAFGCVVLLIKRRSALRTHQLSEKLLVRNENGVADCRSYYSAV